MNRKSMTSTPSALRSSTAFLYICARTDESEPELQSVAVGLLTVISDHATVQSPVHYHPVRIIVILESDAMVGLPRLGEAFLVIFGLIYAQVADPQE